ncbi:MAG: 4Fe-4S dicluster domain-containing protein [Bacillota bacterium]
MVLEKVNIEKERCKGCHICISACPQNVLKVSTNNNKKGYYPAEVVDIDECISCGICALVCPDVVISVYRDKRKEISKK